MENIMTLSKKKKLILEFIRDFIVQNEESPTYEEIKTGLGFSSVGTVSWYVRELIKTGHLQRQKGFSGKRALAVVDDLSNQLPLLGRIAAGYRLEAVENREMVEVPPSWIHPSNFVLQVRGNSMIDDNIEDGDYVIIRQTEQAEARQTIIAYVNGEATLKRYYPKASGVELHPRNPEFDIIHVSPHDEFRIGGVVLHVFRNY